MRSNYIITQLVNYGDEIYRLNYFMHCKNMVVILTQNVVNSVACVVTRSC